MILNDLFQKNKDNIETINILAGQLYPEFETITSWVEHVFKSVLQQEPVDNLENISIMIKEYDVYGITPNSSERYGLALNNWSEWLGYNISEDIDLSEEEILIHCIYEMSWYGTEEDICEVRKELHRRLDGN